MKKDSLVIEGKDSNLIMNWAKDSQNLISVLPNVVSVEGNTFIKFHFTRMLFFSFESKFRIEKSNIENKVIEYNLVDPKLNKFEILFITEGQKRVRISISYFGDKEWIVGNALRKMLTEIERGIEKELSKLEVTPQAEDYSHKLAKISYLSKLIIKSKLVDSESVKVPQGGLVDYLEQVMAQYSQYPVIYVSGTGSSTFRVLFINGDLKGIYVLDNDKEYFGDEEILNKLYGEFKVNIYVMITPKILEVLR
ncbi:MAG: hypothetical protein OWQ54_09310 [Sulfolobaceae archaeon]|nr:hypothetical protein [Sulfolobaceae archaeon]